MQILRFRKFAVVAMILLSVVLLSACGASAITRPVPTVGAAMVSVSGSCEIALEDGFITVSGETDIMDGALIHLSIVSQDGMIVDSVKFTKNGDAVSHRFTVTADKYDDSIMKVTGFITCAPSLYGAQPEGVYNVYGKDFENIEGDFLWNNDGIIILFASEMVDFSR